MKQNISKIIIGVLIVLVLIFGYFAFYKNRQTGELVNQNNDDYQIPVGDTKDDADVSEQNYLGNREDLLSFSIASGSKVSGKITVSGSIKGGYFFEGNLPITILDANKNQTSYGPGHGDATTDWMTAGAVSFKIDFDFSKIPNGYYFIKITQDDPSGGEGGRPIRFVLIPIIVENNQTSTVQTQKIIRDKYSFEAPKDWIVSTPINYKGCLWDGISNDTSDGHRMAGEIGIYPKSCFDISKSNGIKENTIKDGYYILAYYDKETGTTDAEIAETKLAYKKVVETFSLNNSTTYTYRNHGFTMELPVGSVPQETQSETGPAISISLIPSRAFISYKTNASYYEQFALPYFKYINDQKIGEHTFKVYSYDEHIIYWFRQGNVGYEFTGDINLLKTFKFVGWN